MYACMYVYIYIYIHYLKYHIIKSFKLIYCLMKSIYNKKWIFVFNFLGIIVSRRYGYIAIEISDIPVKILMDHDLFIQLTPSERLLKDKYLKGLCGNYDGIKSSEYKFQKLLYFLYSRIYHSFFFDFIDV